MASVAKMVRDHEAEILRDWLEQAGRAASARGLRGPEFSNMVPRLLAAFGEGDGAARRTALVTSHVSDRLRQGFDLAEIVEELAILGRSIASTWRDRPPSERPAPDDVQRMHDEIARATTIVTSTFVDHMLQEEQTEKRYRRLLQQLASEALQPDAAPFRSRVREVLSLVQEAMGAESAALLLYEADTQRLVTAAATGAAEGALQRYATSLDPSSFAGRLTSADSAARSDAVSTELEVASTLRDSGIRALLGTRLPPLRALLGVVFVGRFDPRPFSDREVRRIEALGEALTLHLDNAKLHAELQARVAALEEERALRERFVAVLAHDLRGPLTTAKIAAQALARRPELLGTRCDLATRIARGIDRADRMVGDLLDANRIRAGERLALDVAPAELVAIASDVVEELRAIHGDRFAIEGDVRVEGWWSAPDVRRALWNLVVNAVKYGAPDGPITIRVARTGRDRVEASVHNAGPPIPVVDQVHLFEPYARTLSAQAIGPRGWGLGLTLVHGCAEAHGGRVKVESALAEGTTFTVELPIDARPFQPGGHPREVPPPTAH